MLIAIERTTKLSGVSRSLLSLGRNRVTVMALMVCLLTFRAVPALRAQAPPSTSDPEVQGAASPDRQTSGPGGDNQTTSIGDALPFQFPGTTDPVGNPTHYAVFRSDAYAAMMPKGQASTWKHAQFTSPSTNNPIPVANGTQLFSASGHILAPAPSSIVYPEDVVYAHRSGSSVKVDFLNPSHSSTGVSLDGLADRVSKNGVPPFDNIAIAVGDLDRALDANNQTSQVFSKKRGTPYDD
jgi:hypothetical protein